MRTLFIKHDGSVESVDGLVAGDSVIRNDIEYKTLDWLRHPKTGAYTCRILVATACHPMVNPYRLIDGLRIDVRSGKVG